MDFDNLLTPVQQPFGEEPDGDLKRQQPQKHVFNSTLWTIIIIIITVASLRHGAHGFGKQTVAEGLFLSCMELL